MSTRSLALALLLVLAPPAAAAVPFEPPRSSEPERGRSPCRQTVRLFGLPIGSFDFSIVLPAWVPVIDRRPVTLEGTVVQDFPRHHGPRVSSEDFPSAHYTHDVCFEVEPDPTPDRRFERMLGVQEDPVTGDRQQRRVEVEWECGLGAANPGNPLAQANRRGDGAGFFGAGHRRGETLWAWPEIDDWVHIEGQWVWDRGHPPAKTEIHPPRLVVTRRALPVVIDRRLGPVAGRPGDPVLATRVDVFASGDGGAIWNNRPDAPPWVYRVPMHEKDYGCDVRTIVPPPSPGARLRTLTVIHRGDSFPERAVDPATRGDAARLALPWKSLDAPDTAIYARSIYLFWDEGLGAPPAWRPRAVRVTLDDVGILKTQEPVDAPGEFRLFADVAGSHLFLNDFARATDVVNEGLGRARPGDVVPIRRSFLVLVPPGGRYRVCASGWEADGVDRLMGNLYDPESPCDMRLEEWFTANLFRPDVGAAGINDDPIGDVSDVWDEATGLGVGTHGPVSAGGFRPDLLPGFSHDPDRTYRLRYQVEEVPLERVLAGFAR